MARGSTAESLASYEVRDSARRIRLRVVMTTALKLAKDLNKACKALDKALRHIPTTSREYEELNEVLAIVQAKASAALHKAIDHLE